VTFFRLAGFVAVILSNWLFLRKARQLNQPPDRISLLILHGVALLAVAFSFTLAGHVSVLSITARVAIILHFSAFACWIGSLFPLLLLTRSVDLEFMHWTMRRFGNNALVIVLILAVAGVLMLIEVIASPGELVTTAYGLSLLLKLVLVLTIVGIAGLNKLLLVPAISSESSGAKLGKSIRVESVVATLILLLTAYSSTIIGPAGH
jgi:putative copper resistance protein D